MKIVICDDDKNDAEKIKQLVEKITDGMDYEIKVKYPQDVNIAVEEDLLKCDMVIMDIQFLGEQFDGIALGTKINEKLPICQIIYLTNVLDFAPQVYETRHCYFVMKENMECMLPRAIKKATDTYNDTICNDIIEFLSNGHKVFISQGEIMYIERDDRILIIHTDKRSYPCYTSLKKIMSKLGNSFVRCHGGFIVNLFYVTGMESSELILKNGKNLPVGKRFFDEFKLSYLKFNADRM